LDPVLKKKLWPKDEFWPFWEGQNLKWPYFLGKKIGNLYTKNTFCGHVFGQKLSSFNLFKHTVTLLHLSSVKLFPDVPDHLAEV